MEKKISLIPLIIVLLMFILVGSITAYKVSKNHTESLLRVASQKIEEAALLCTLEEVCTDEKTTLGYLINKGYIKPQVHPITKEYIGDTLVIECKNYACKTEVK